LDETPSIDVKGDALKNQLKAILARAKTQSARSADAAAEKDRLRLDQDFTAWKKEYEEWLKSMQPSANTNQ
jgi:hypothetical protein